jgi:outer membrane protein TolC
MFGEEFMRLIALLTGLASLALAQDPLTLEDAVKEALANHPSLEAAKADVAAADARIGQAKTGYLPHATYTEYFQRANQPVFAFGALLNQRRFTQADFDVNKLNHPGWVNNFQSQVGVEQIIWDFGGTRSRIRTAEIGKQMTQEEERAARMRRIAAVARAYAGATLAGEGVAVAEAALKSAEADLERAKARRDAGMAIDADVLTIEVHLAAAREQRIQRSYEAQVAMAALNESLGLPLETRHQLVTPLAPAPLAQADGNASGRPEIRQAALARELNEAQRNTARTALYPQIVAKGVFEADRGQFASQGGANWFFGAGLKWTIFDGMADRRRGREVEAMAVASGAREREVKSQVALQLRQARAAVDSAAERVTVASASVAQAEESLRIVKNRYEAGLAAVSDLLRNETALAEARMRRLTAIHDQRIAAVTVALAAGELEEGSDVLR